MSTATQSSAEERHSRPAASEYSPYYSRYIDRVPAGDIVEILRTQIVEASTFLRGIPNDKTTSGYAPGKWTVRDIVGHVADTERIMSYRALRFARGDRTPLPGFEESDYAPNARASDREMADLVSELELVRASTVALFTGLPADSWGRAGSANGNEISVRALAAVIAGHERHHLAVIRERYLAGR
jgi:DinB superfamily